MRRIVSTDGFLGPPRTGVDLNLFHKNKNSYLKKTHIFKNFKGLGCDYTVEAFKVLLATFPTITKLSSTIGSPGSESSSTEQLTLYLRPASESFLLWNPLKAGLNIK